jgi:hypothetical protein
MASLVYKNIYFELDFLLIILSDDSEEIHVLELYSVKKETELYQQIEMKRKINEFGVK